MVTSASRRRVAVVTHMQVRLHPLTNVLGGRLVYDFEDALELGRVYRELMAVAATERPDQVTDKGEVERAFQVAIEVPLGYQIVERDEDRVIEPAGFRRSKHERLHGRG